MPFFKRTVTREDNIQNFKDTENLCKTNLNLQRAISKSNENQKLILENEEIFCEKKVYENPAKILVTPNRTFEAAMNYPEKKSCSFKFCFGHKSWWGSCIWFFCPRRMFVSVFNFVFQFDRRKNEKWILFVSHKTTKSVTQ